MDNLKSKNIKAKHLMKDDWFYLFDILFRIVDVAPNRMGGRVVTAREWSDEVADVVDTPVTVVLNNEHEITIYNQ